MDKTKDTTSTTISSIKDSDSSSFFSKSIKDEILPKKEEVPKNKPPSIDVPLNRAWDIQNRQKRDYDAKKAEKTQVRSVFKSFEMQGNVDEILDLCTQKFNSSGMNEKILEFAQHPMEPHLTQAIKTAHGASFQNTIPIEKRDYIRLNKPIMHIAQAARHIYAMSVSRRQEVDPYLKLLDMDIEVPESIVPLLQTIGEFQLSNGLGCLAYPKSHLRQLAVGALQAAAKCNEYDHCIHLNAADQALIRGQNCNPMLIKASQSQENRDIIEYLGLQAGELPTTVPISMYNIRYDALVPKHDMAMLCADPIIVNALDAQHDLLGQKIVLKHTNCNLQIQLGQCGFTQTISSDDDQIVDSLLNIYSEWSDNYMTLNSAIRRVKLPKFGRGCAFQAIPKSGNQEMSSQFVLQQIDYYMAKLFPLCISVYAHVNKYHTTTESQQKLADEFIVTSLPQ